MSQVTGFEDVVAFAEENKDQTKPQTSGERVLPPAGETIGRLCSYVELGPQVHEYNGKETIRPTVHVGFELLHPTKNIREGRGMLLGFRKMHLSLHEKARFFKLFEAMRYGRKDIKHMARLLGEPFRLTIEHTEDGKYANIAAVSKPYTLDPISNDETALKVPPLTCPVRLFIWDDPYRACWESLYIDGTYTKDGIEMSKNWMQDTIRNSPSWIGSAVEAMLSVSAMNDVPF